LYINFSIGIKNAKDEPVGNLFELFDAGPHLLELSLRVDEVTATWTDHDEHWNGNLDFDVAESSEIWSRTSNLRAFAKLNPISSSLICNQCRLCVETGNLEKSHRI
jgi:hypothetical protein